MITVPTHKHHKSPFKHSKTIYVFTSGRVIVTVEIDRRKKILKGVKMTTAKWKRVFAGGFSLRFKNTLGAQALRWPRPQENPPVQEPPLTLVTLTKGSNLFNG